VYFALSSSLMKSSAKLVGRLDQVTQKAGHVRPNGKRMGEEGVLSGVVPELFILPGLKSVFL